jgi:PKD repeat protein
MVGMNRSCLYLSSGCIVIVLVLLAAPVTGAMGPALGAVDITDNNIRMVVVGTKEECASACDAEPACLAATFVLPGTIQGPDGHCYLKSASTPQTDNFNCYSFEKLIILPVTIGCVMSNPKADFGMTSAGNKPPKGFAPLVVQFTDMSAGAYGWSWDFGDGSAVSTDKNPVHTYTAGSPGGTYYDVTLTVTGSCAGETSTSKKSQIVRVFDNIGFLGLASTPGGASVYIDGSLVAGMTSTVPGEPLHLTPGSHTVRLTLDGYRDYSDTVTVVNGVVTQLSPVLVKITSATTSSPSATTTSPPATGSLQITTIPDGAAVLVDGGSRGTTPVTISGLAAGSHTVTLTKAGYTDYQTTLSVAGGKTTPLNVKLVAGQGTPAATKTTTTAPSETVSIPVSPPPSVPGNLTVRSTPAGANVYIDGEKVGTTPVQVQDLKPGSHKLLLTLQGYGDISQTIDVTGGSDREVSVDFSTGKKTPGFTAPVSLAALAFVLLVLPGRRKGGGSQ